MRVLVTGSEGFIGRHLCRALKDREVEVERVDLKLGSNVLSVDLPINVDRVFHLAAQTDARSTDYTVDAETNVMGTLRICEAYGPKVVHASTSMVNYPCVSYAISKRAAEEYALMFGAAVVRLCNITGSGGHGVHEVFSKAPVIRIRGDGTQQRSYATIGIAVSALLESRPGELHIVRGKDLTVLDIANNFNKPKEFIDPDPDDIVDGRQLYA